MGIRGSLGRWWRRARRQGAVATLLLAAMAAWPGASRSQAPEPRETTLLLRWSSDWTPTDVVVREKDTLSIDIRRGAAADGEVDGNLQQQFFEGFANGPPLDKFLGRIGDGPAFPIESGFRQVMARPGTLSLRWDVPEFFGRHVPGYTLVIRVEPAPKPKEPEPDPEPDPENEQIATNMVSPESNVASDRGPVEEVPAAKPVVEPRSDEPEDRAGIAWPAAGLALLLLIAAAAATGVALQRTGRARTIKRTRALLSLSPRLDLGEGIDRGGDLPAEGPAASLRARLEPGAVRMAEGEKDG